jgi:DNA-binding response OmpR family regulator
MILVQQMKPLDNILVFNTDNAESLAFLLGERFGYSVQHVSTMDDLMARIKQARFDLLILDLCDDYCRELAERFQRLPGKVLFLTCGEDMHSYPMPTGAENIMQIPLDPLEFIRTVRTLLGENLQ